MSVARWTGCLAVVLLLAGGTTGPAAPPSPGAAAANSDYLIGPGDRLGIFVCDNLKDPHVTVMVRDFVGPLDRQIRVIGEATDPQAIPYRNGMTVLDVMIATKGLTRYAAGNRAVIVRHLGTKQETIHVRRADLIKDGGIAQNVEMRPGNTLIIPRTWF